jgi:DNA-directed RNA polymerase specialized sigma24 family protein
MSNLDELNWTADGPTGSSGFETDWLVVGTAGLSTPEAASALEKVCRTYWYPLYAHVRRKGYDSADAQDLTQEFFTRLLGKPWLRDVHPSKGKFRSFLLASMNHFLANEWRRGQTLKRGGSQPVFSIDAAGAEECLRLEPAHDHSPDKLFDYHWALQVLYRAQTRLEAECLADGKAALYAELKEMLNGDKLPGTYGQAAARLGLTEAAVKKAAQRLRERYQELIRAETAETVSNPFEVEEELRHLFASVRQ